jgi:hypothetical protein
MRNKATSEINLSVERKATMLDRLFSTVVDKHTFARKDAELTGISFAVDQLNHLEMSSFIKIVKKILENYVNVSKILVVYDCKQRDRTADETVKFQKEIQILGKRKSAKLNFIFGGEPKPSRPTFPIEPTLFYS